MFKRFIFALKLEIFIYRSRYSIFKLFKFFCLSMKCYRFMFWQLICSYRLISTKLQDAEIQICNENFDFLRS